MIYDLKTMEKHAQVAVETLNSYRDIRADINEWLDEQYLQQCRVAAECIRNTKDEDITREYLNDLAETLEVRHIYLFDKNGRTVVTNSPHDHFELSSDKGSQSYAFRVLLDGADHVIQEPCENDVLGEYMQYIGVSLRDENDLCSGFVQIGIDPSLRDRLTKPFDVDTVLNNLVIGLPEHALAVDKETLTVKETTGPGFKGDPVEKLGITNDNLISRLSSSLWINGREYYAGFGEASDVYLVPIVPRSGYLGSFLTSCFLAVLTFACMSAVSFTALRKYDEYAAAIKDSEPETAEEEETAENAAADEDDESDNGIFSGFSELVKQDKFMFEERWNIAETGKAKQNPETRIRLMIYRILAAVCAINLFPALYCKLFGVNSNEELDGLSYIIMGQWEKGLNIFAVSSCIFLLFALYIFIVVTDRILYGIAKISDTRVETICLLIRSSLKYICACVFVYFGLSQFGIATQTLLASAGILSLIIGLGAKDLVNDIIAGFFIIFEGTLKVGDFVTLGSWYGTVTQVGLRTTKITFFADTKIINNSAIKDIINTNGDAARRKIKFPIPYDVDLLYVEEILERELPLLTGKIPALLKPPKYGGVSSIEDSCILLRITVFAKPYKANKGSVLYCVSLS